MSAKEFPWWQYAVALTAGNCAVLVVPSVEVRMKAQHSISHLRLHDLLLESFAFYILILKYFIVLKMYILRSPNQLSNNKITTFWRIRLSCFLASTESCVGFWLNRVHT
jgi:hypothetical protein